MPTLSLQFINVLHLGELVAKSYLKIHILFVYLYVSVQISYKFKWNHHPVKFSFLRIGLEMFVIILAGLLLFFFFSKDVYKFLQVYKFQIRYLELRRF